MCFASICGWRLLVTLNFREGGRRSNGVRQGVLTRNACGACKDDMSARFHLACSYDLGLIMVRFMSVIMPS